MRILAVTEAPGDRVVVWAPNTVEWIIAYHC
jgi:acyl-CoA synthetase (AMP-forming)/AMP-acid ligase II